MSTSDPFGRSSGPRTRSASSGDREGAVVRCPSWLPAPAPRNAAASDRKPNRNGHLERDGLVAVDVQHHRVVGPRRVPARGQGGRERRLPGAGDAAEDDEPARCAHGARMEYLVPAELHDQRQDVAEVRVLDETWRDPGVGDRDHARLVGEEAKRRRPGKMRPVVPSGRIAVGLEAVVSGIDLHFAVGGVREEPLPVGPTRRATSSGTSACATTSSSAPLHELLGFQRPYERVDLGRYRFGGDLVLVAAASASISVRLLPSERSSQKRAPVGLSEKIRFVFRWTSTTSSPSRRDTTSGLGAGSDPVEPGRGIGRFAIHVSYLPGGTAVGNQSGSRGISRAMSSFSVPIGRWGILRGDEGEAQGPAGARGARAATGGRLMPRDPLAHPERLIRAVYAYVAYRVGPGPDAEDITSDVFERALRYRDELRPEARRADGLADRHRPPVRERRRPRSAPCARPRRGTRCARRPRRRCASVASRWLDAVSQLSERDRDLIALRYGADLTGRQIGAILDMSANAVDVAVHRAVERLRQALDGPDESEAASPRCRLRGTALQ